MSIGISTYEIDARIDAEHKVIRDRLLVDLIWNSCDHPETIRRRLEEKGIHPYFSYPTLALFEIASSFQDAWTKRTAANKLRTIIEERISCNCAVFVDDVGHIGVLFSWDDQETIRNLQHCLQGNYSYPVTVGIGNPCHSLSDLHTSYSQAMFALQHKFYRGINQVIWFNSVQSFANTVEYPEDEEEDLFQMLNDPAAKPVGQVVDAFYEALLRNGPLQREEISDATIHLLIRLELRAKTAAGQACALMKPDIMSILHIQSLDEMKASILRYLQRVGNAICSKDSMNRTIIKKTLTFMEDEYDRASLHYVAEKVFITPAYLSTLFKTNMGVTFIEHLTDIRISKAKKLLKQSHLKNYEVAERVGYHDSRYFSQIFKKKVGLTPSDFRESIQVPS
jgi:two-component system response regulator YesN